MAHNEPCCGNDHDHDSFPELSDILDDPTLADCCRRDVIQQRKSQAIKDVLLEHDPTTAGLKAYSGVIASTPPQASTSHQSSASSDSQQPCITEDGEILLLRQTRLKELQQRAMQQSKAQQLGFGVLNDVPESSLLAEVERRDGCAVCHISVQGSELCSHIDQHLEGLAHVYRATFFACVAVPKKSRSLAAQLRLDSLPAIVCFKNASVVGRSPTTMFGWEVDVAEEQLDAYFKRLGVLHQGHPDASISGRSELRGDDSSSDDSDFGESGAGGGGNDDTPCEVCGRCYPHEHVRAVYRRQDSDDEDDDSDFD